MTLPMNSSENGFSIKSIGEKLKAARNSQNKSLDDIAASTKINKMFLEEIENGIKPNLPSTYIRAFIKEYASEVGISTSELFEEEASIKSKVSSDLELKPSSLANLEEKKNKSNTLVLLIIAAILGLVLIFSFVLLRNKDSKSKITEISFSDVIKEQEAKLGTKTSPDDTNKSELKSIAETQDTLILEGVAIESVWVKIVIDGASTNEYVFPPFYRKQWKAKNYFLISLGNAAAISFSLNGIKLGTLAPLRKSIKNFQINWETFNKVKK